MQNLRRSLIPAANSIGTQFAALVFLAACLAAWSARSHSDLPFVVWSLVAGAFALLFSRVDYLNPLPAFLFPWLVITSFGGLELSQYARPLSNKTYVLVWVIELSAFVAYYLACKKPLSRKRIAAELVSLGRFSVLVWGFIILSVFNVTVAGYVPLIAGIRTGDPGYLDFGVHGIYGFYNAFANALGILSLFMFLRTKGKRYLAAWLLICAAFILFVSRQNVLSMVVQSVIVYCFVKGRISPKKLAAGMVLALLLFSFAGNLRSGDIKQIAGIKTEYQDLPDAAVWIYAYSYFNVLNLDNVLTDSRVPVYDGSSVLSLLPTFLRPELSHIDDEIELEQFNAYSYVAPIYADVGLWGSVLFTLGIMWWTMRSYQHVLQDGSFYSIAKYSVLFFCALFSFFVNFWFYLPVICEIPILAWMSHYVLGVGTTRGTRSFAQSPLRT